ncbi:NUDIX hydrolase [Halomonas sp. M4R1S46]|uniref:NUDIX hydrolase n=1 Tax=Halomonas sp. M4R1S46 TaxID=2982692 RepID=UPI0021E3A637|nr:NUDIX hydrolase [Halomonas sp. M4R1S46]UYG09582.1 NUDIX hydrolase [Halomonas sp. M4R1S46]
MSGTQWPRVAVSAAVVRDARLLMVRRAHPPNAGRLALPGGKVEPGESLHQAVRRELREETGVEGRVREVVTALDVFDRDSQGALRAHFVIVVLRVDWRGGEAVAGGDAEALCWLDLAGLEAAGDTVCGPAAEIARRLLAAPPAQNCR